MPKPIQEYADLSRPGLADSALTKADLVEHGAEIEKFFASGVWDRTVSNARADILGEWEKSESAADREMLFARLRALEHVQARLTYAANKGRIVGRELEQERERELATARRSQSVRAAR